MTRKLRATPVPVPRCRRSRCSAIFVVYPIVAVVYYSFTDYDIVRPPVWVGLDNYQKLLADDTFWLALTHSFVYLIVTPILIVLSIALAIVVNRQLRGIHIYRALYFVPAVSGSIAIGLSWRWLFERNGFINSVLQSLGHHPRADPVAGRRPRLVLPIAMLLTIWAGVGYYSVIFLAGLQNIPEELYDAARIDGCNDFQKHRHVSMPGLRPQIVFVAVISSLAALKVFDEIYVLTNQTGGDPRQRRDDGLLPLEAGVPAAATRATRRRSRSRCCAITLVFSIVNVRLLERGQDGEAMSGAGMPELAESVAGAAERAARPARAARIALETALWYVVLTAIAVDHGLPVRLDAADVAQGPARPDHLGAAAVHPERPDARQLREGPRQPADPDASS